MPGTATILERSCRTGESCAPCIDPIDNMPTGACEGQPGYMDPDPGDSGNPSGSGGTGGAESRDASADAAVDASGVFP